MPRHRKKPRALLDYDTIAAASTGDPDAMAEVLIQRCRPGDEGTDAAEAHRQHH